MTYKKKYKTLLLILECVVIPKQKKKKFKIKI